MSVSSGHQILERFVHRLFIIFKCTCTQIFVNILKAKIKIKNESCSFLFQHLLSLKKQGAISDQFYQKIRPCGSQPARLYGLPKVHKDNHPLRPICSSVNSYNYKLASELASILSPYTKNSFTVKNSFTFVNEIKELTVDESFLCSFDVKSLFTSIPLNETIEIALNYLFRDSDKVQGLSRPQFKKLLEIATKETNFIFNSKFYDQIDGVAMGSPLAPVLANLFMRNFEERVFELFSGEPPIYYRRYVDDSFIIFKNKNDVQPFFEFMNKFHEGISFTKEEETTTSTFFPFLDVKVTRTTSGFVTSTFYKPTHTGLYTDWNSFTPRKYKFNLVKTLLSRAWNICSNKELFEHDCQTIKDNLMKNHYPEKLVDAVIRNFKEKQESREVAEKLQTVPKLEVMMMLPFHGLISEKLRRNLTNLFKDAYPQVSLKIVYKTTNRLSNLFMFKDVIPLRLKSHLVYGVHCTDCPAVYVGKTKRHLGKRFKEHLDVRKPSAVTEHLMRTNHSTNLESVKVLATGKSDTELLIKESLTIKRLKPVLNNQVASYPLEMF